MAKISKKKKNELRQKPVAVLKSILKRHYRRIAFASTRGDWACIDRDSPMIDFIKQYLKGKNLDNLQTTDVAEAVKSEEKTVIDDNEMK